ncbi:hypothetical protein VTI28DRAFT_4642 [Corynascus sepedonium]
MLTNLPLFFPFSVSYSHPLFFPSAVFFALFSSPFLSFVITICLPFFRLHTSCSLSFFSLRDELFLEGSNHLPTFLGNLYNRETRGGTNFIIESGTACKRETNSYTPVSQELGLAKAKVVYSNCIHEALTYGALPFQISTNRKDKEERNCKLS